MRTFERAFIWGGGALFVVSLAVCAWSYLVSWSEPHRLARDLFAGRDPFDGLAAAVDILLFSLFAAHHSVFARARVRQALARIVPERLLRSVYVWTASLMLIVVCLAWRRVGGELYAVTGARAVAHAATQIVGLVFIARAVARIDPLELAGIRPLSAAAGLQTDGPFRLVRHPLYLGWILVVFGAPHMTHDRLLFAAISSIYLIVAVPWEERALLQSFGPAYAKYQREVRWRVIPYVY